MKRMIAGILALCICLSLCACGSSGCTCDCAQCAQCEKKTHTHETADNTKESPAAENDPNKIVFPEPVLLAQDSKVRVELVSFIQEDSPWKDIGKYVALRFTNYADYEVGVRLENLAVDNSSADASYSSGETPDILPGETTTYFIEIRDTFNHALESLDQLYTLKGRFKVMRRTGSNSYADSYEIPFSVPDALNGGNSSAAADPAADSLKNSPYLGKWKVTEIQFAEDSGSAENAELWESYLTAMLGAFENVYFVFAESGECCYHSDNATNIAKWMETETGLTAGTIVLEVRGDQLVEEIDGYLLFWDKVSDSQAFPEA